MEGQPIKGLEFELSILKETTEFETCHELINTKNTNPQTKTLRTKLATIYLILKTWYGTIPSHASPPRPP